MKYNCRFLWVQDSLQQQLASIYSKENSLFDSRKADLIVYFFKDDYINASHIRNLLAAAHSPKFVATQSPTSKTINDFWTMVWQESTEIIICLLHELDYVYWPKDRKEPFKVDPDLEITLQSTKTEPGTPFVERIFTLSNTVSHTSRVVIHLQLMPAQFANEVCSKDSCIYHG